MKTIDEIFGKIAMDILEKRKVDINEIPEDVREQIAKNYILSEPIILATLSMFHGLYDEIRKLTEKDYRDGEIWEYIKENHKEFYKDLINIAFYEIIKSSLIATLKQ